MSLSSPSPSSSSASTAFISSLSTPCDNEDEMLKRLNGYCFKGHKQDLYPSGTGEYVFQNGTVYAGQFCQGMFHGCGTLTFPNGARFISEWQLGRLVNGHYIFEDGLVYDSESWSYATDADRRFYSEYGSGIEMQHNVKLVNSLPNALPYACYDLGDCFLAPNGHLYEWGSDGKSYKFYREPTPHELVWATRKCRIGLDPSIPTPH